MFCLCLVFLYISIYIYTSWAVAQVGMFWAETGGGEYLWGFLANWSSHVGSAYCIASLVISAMQQNRSMDINIHLRKCTHITSRNIIFFLSKSSMKRSSGVDNKSSILSWVWKPLRVSVESPRINFTLSQKPPRYYLGQSSKVCSSLI